jgi:hypothetical protein
MFSIISILYLYVFPHKNFFNLALSEIVGNFGYMETPYKKNSVFPYVLIQ